MSCHVLSHVSVTVPAYCPWHAPAKIKRGGHFGVPTGMWVFQNITLHRATNSAESQAKIRLAFHFLKCNIRQYSLGRFMVTSLFRKCGSECWYIILYSATPKGCLDFFCRWVQQLKNFFFYFLFLFFWMLSTVGVYWILHQEQEKLIPCIVTKLSCLLLDILKVL